MPKKCALPAYPSMLRMRLNFDVEDLFIYLFIYLARTKERMNVLQMKVV